MCEPGPRAVAPPAARQGPDGRRLRGGVAGAPAREGERRLGGPLRALVQGGLRRASAPLPAHPPHRARDRAAARGPIADHRDRLPDRLEQPGHLRAHLPRRHRLEPRRAPRARAGRARRPRQRARLLPARGAAAGPHNRSFGEAAAADGRYNGRPETEAA